MKLWYHSLIARSHNSVKNYREYVECILTQFTHVKQILHQPHIQAPHTGSHINETYVRLVLTNRGAGAHPPGMDASTSLEKKKNILSCGRQKKNTEYNETWPNSMVAKTTNLSHDMKRGGHPKSVIWRPVFELTKVPKYVPHTFFSFTL